MQRLREAQKQLVGARIRRARKAAGLSHDKLARMVGSSRQHLIKLEKGLHLPGDELLSAIATATGKGEAWFYSDGDDEDDPSSMPLTAEAEFLEALRPLAVLMARRAR